MSKEFENENDGEFTVTLSLDNGEELECAVITIFEAGDNDYIALLPLEGEEADEGEVFLYRYSETDNGEPVLDNIESDEEYDIVSDAFDEFLDSQEFDELVDADDEELYIIRNHKNNSPQNTYIANLNLYVF